MTLVLKTRSSVPIRRIPEPERLFKHSVTDFVDMVKQMRGKRYMLVTPDRFNRLVKATPSADQSASTEITFLTRELIPRFGIPSENSLDNGSAFVQLTINTATATKNKAETRLCVSSFTGWNG